MAPCRCTAECTLGAQCEPSGILPKFDQPGTRCVRPESARRRFARRTSPRRTLPCRGRHARRRSIRPCMGRRAVAAIRPAADTVRRPCSGQRRRGRTRARRQTPPGSGRVLSVSRQREPSHHASRRSFPVLLFPGFLTASAPRPGIVSRLVRLNGRAGNSRRSAPGRPRAGGPNHVSGLGHNGSAPQNRASHWSPSRSRRSRHRVARGADAAPEAGLRGVLRAHGIAACRHLGACRHVGSVASASPAALQTQPLDLTGSFRLPSSDRRRHGGCPCGEVPTPTPRRHL